MISITIVGEVLNKPTLKVDKDKSVLNLLVGSKRHFKNTNGEYKFDIVDCTLWNGLAVYAKNLKQGEKVAIKGRMQNKNFTSSKGNVYANEVVVEEILLIERNL